MNSDDGNYTDIPLDVSTKMAHTQLSAAEYRCLFYLLLVTHGRHNTRKVLSIANISAGTAMSKRRTRNAMNGLVNTSVVLRTNAQNRRGYHVYQVNFDTDSWGYIP